MSIIDDFADIAKRMKGELAPKPKVEEQPTNPAGNVGCPPAPPTQAPMRMCLACNGTGIEQSTRGGGCNYCLARGYLP